MAIDRYAGIQYKREGDNYGWKFRTRLNMLIDSTSKNILIDFLNDDIYSTEIGLFVSVADSLQKKKRKLGIFAKPFVKESLERTGLMKLKNVSIYEKKVRPEKADATLEASLSKDLEDLVRSLGI